MSEKTLLIRIGDTDRSFAVPYSIKDDCVSLTNEMRHDGSFGAEIDSDKIVVHILVIDYNKEENLKILGSRIFYIICI